MGVPERRAPGLLVIGLDAADAQSLADHCEALPNIARLMDRGRSVTIDHEPGLYTGSVWPTLNTGLRLSRHGRYFFKQFDRKTYLDRRIWAEDLPGALYWERASKAGRRVAVIDPPKSRLASTLNGVQILDWTSHDPEGPVRSFPAEEVHNLPDHAALGDRNASCDRLLAEAGPRRLLDLLTERVEAKTEYALSLLARQGWDLFTVVYNDTHCAGHQFWSLHDPSHPDHDADLAAEIGDPLVALLQRVDDGIGRLIDAASDADILFFTSHGMRAHYDATQMLDETLRRLDEAETRARPASPAPIAKQRLGALSVARSAWRRAVPRAVRDLLPGLARLSIRIESDRRAARRCFAIPSNDNAGAMRLNVKGREPEGRVDAHEAEDFLSYLERELRALRNEETGRPVVRGVHRPRPVLDGKNDDLPDLVLQWNRDEPIRAVTSPTVGSITPAYVGGRTGDHRSYGLAILLGAWDRAVATRGRAEDVPATILDLLGVEPGDIDGRSVLGARLSS